MTQPQPQPQLDYRGDQMPQQIQRVIRAAACDDLSLIQAMWDKCETEAKEFIGFNCNQILGAVARYGSDYSFCVLLNFLWCQTEGHAHIWPSPTPDPYFFVNPHICGRLGNDVFIFTEDTDAFVAVKAAEPSLQKSWPFSFFTEPVSYSRVLRTLESRGHTVQVEIRDSKHTRLSVQKLYLQQWG